MAERRPPKDPGRGQPVSDLLPEHPTLAAVRAVAKGCKACPLYLRGTQTVFGEGPRRAELMLVGEQPGDAEDIAGHPFVGPAGKLLDRALDEVFDDIRQIDSRTIDLLGKAFKVSRQRGELVASSLAPIVTATVHPSSILRAPDDEARRNEMGAFVADLTRVARALARQGKQ